MAQKVILSEQELTKFSTWGNGLSVEYLPAITVVIGEIYQVYWNGILHECVASYVDFSGNDAIGLGNLSMIGLGEDTGEEFVIGIVLGTPAVIAEWDIGEPYHTLAIYQETVGVDIVLKDLNGDDIVYEGVNKVALTDVDGNDVIFSEGELMEGIEIDLDMSSGDQTVEAPEGYLVKKATIKKPETLRPENILQDVDIAGVVGTHKTSTPKETTIEPDFSEGDMVVTPEDGTMFSKVTIPTPDTLIPENIADGINIAGIIGTLTAGGGGNVKIASGTVKGNGYGAATVDHNLGVIPDLFFAYIATSGAVPSTASSNVLTMCFFMSSALKNTLGWSYGMIAVTPSSTSKKVYHGRSSNTLDVSPHATEFGGSVTTKSLTFGGGLGNTSAYSVHSSYGYGWFAIGGLFS